MTTPSPQEITQLLLAWGNGDQAALDKLTPLVYEELRRLARRYMRREPPGHSLQSSDLAHKAFLRLIDQRNLRWQNRVHFFAIAARMMRQILVDEARRRFSAKRGGGEKVPLDGLIIALPGQDADLVDLIALDEALERLAAIDPRKSRIVELRFFGGLSVKEVAEVLKVAPITVAREWKSARAWLYRELNRGEHDDTKRA